MPDTAAEASEADTQADVQPDIQPCSVADAIAIMGCGEDLSASMIAGIEAAVENNTTHAEAAAIEESIEEAEKAEADAEAEEAGTAADYEEFSNKFKETDEAEDEAEEVEAGEEEIEVSERDAELVEHLVAMGFEHGAAINAISASDGDIEQAVNMLMDPVEQPAEDPKVPRGGVPTLFRLLESGVRSFGHMVAGTQSVVCEDGANADADTQSIPEDSTKAEPEWNGEWDALVEDLEEMGFADIELNREVLVRADGDMREAVKELVCRERQSWE